MRIVALSIQNVKAIRAIATPLHEGVNVIGGANAQGKSSLLDAVMYGLAGNKSLPGQPVRRGTDKATIDIDLGELKAHKEILPDGRVKFTVTGKTGGKTPQALLDSLRSDLTFDPTEFARQDAKAQLALLKKLVGLDFTTLDENRASLEQDRLLCGRELKTLQGQLQGMPHDERAPKEQQDAQALAEDLRKARTANAETNKLKTQYATLKSQMEAARAELQRAEEAVVAGKKRLDDMVKQRNILMGVIESAPVADEDGILAQIQDVQRVNALVDANAARARVKAQVEAKQTEYDELTAGIKGIDSTKAGAMENAKFPVFGLSFDENGVLVNGLPWNQASSAEQLKVSLAMGVSLNPTLRVMLIRDGSLLDDSSMQIIAEMCEKNDFQCLVERVGEGDEGALIIEDGKLKE